MEYNSDETSFKIPKNCNIVIAVSGPPGSGKTTLAQNLARALGLRYFSTGIVFRELAKKKGLSLEKLSQLAEANHSIDRYIDSQTINEARKGRVVLDGHLTAWIAKDYADLLIYVTAPLRIRIQRIAERENRSFQEVLRETLAREESERRRFKDIYGIDVNDLSIFDIIINNERFEPHETLSIALEAVRQVVMKKCRVKP